MLKKYNPKKITGGWNNVQFLGFMDGTFVDAEYAEDQVTTHVGSGGDVSVILNANQLATVTITLIQGSPTNKQLSNLVPSAKRNVVPTGAFKITDLNGNTVISGNNAFISKTAKVEFAKNLTGRQWKFIIPEATIVVGEGGD
jgi:Protein of unknown function (DUF3277)